MNIFPKTIFNISILIRNITLYLIIYFSNILTRTNKHSKIPIYVNLISNKNTF